MLPVAVLADTPINCDMHLANTETGWFSKLLSQDHLQVLINS